MKTPERGHVPNEVCSFETSHVEKLMWLFWVKAKQRKRGTAAESDLQNLSCNGSGWSRDTFLSLPLQRTWLQREFLIHVIQRTQCSHHLWVDMLTCFTVSYVSIIDPSHANLAGVREDFRVLVLQRGLVPCWIAEVIVWCVSASFKSGIHQSDETFTASTESEPEQEEAGS